MAKAPGSVSGWAGNGAVWFKVNQITAVTNGGSSISFPAQSKLIPRNPQFEVSLLIILARRPWNYLHGPEEPAHRRVREDVLSPDR